MSVDRDIQELLQQRVAQAMETRTPLAICAGNSKNFLGRESDGEIFSVADHRGILSYEPTELVLTARSGTPLDEIEATLAEQHQLLAFEPPHYGPGATLGGTVAAGLSGPRRAFAGACRDFVLGTGIINGKAEILHFGGQVMKNVAGYDVSRLMTGAMGTLGVLLDISLKVLPVAPEQCSLSFSENRATAITRMNQWCGRPLPLSALAWHDQTLYARLSGTAGGLQSACKKLGGEPLADGESFWAGLREQRHAFFATSDPLWRLSVPSATPPLALPGEVLIEWGGALRWLKTDADASSVRAVTASAGGHALLYRNGDPSGEIYHPLGDGLLRLQQRIKAAFDPLGIFNPGRMYALI